MAVDQAKIRMRKGFVLSGLAGPLSKSHKTGQQVTATTQSGNYIAGQSVKLRTKIGQCLHEGQFVHAKTAKDTKKATTYPTVMCGW